MMEITSMTVSCPVYGNSHGFHDELPNTILDLLTRCNYEGSNSCEYDI